MQKLGPEVSSTLLFIGFQWIRKRLRGALGAFLLFTALLVVFAWTPVVRGRLYAPTDVSGFGGMFIPASGHTTPIRQIDVPTVIIPWLQFDVDEFHKGLLPEWNPYNGSGVPHIGNLQSAAFSPFTIPFYFLSMKWALYLTAYLILMVAGLSTYALIRFLKLPWLSGVAGGILYMYSTFMMVWLRWPLASVAAFLPLIAWSALALIAERDHRRSLHWTSILALVIGFSVLAGHVETLAVGSAFIGTWIVLYLYTRVSSWRVRLQRVGWLALAAILGLCFSAVQLLPFLEYISRSSILAGRSVRNHIDFRWIGTVLFPFTYGAPQLKYQGEFGLATPFHETAIFAVSALGLALSAIGAAVARSMQRMLPYFLCAVSLVALCFAFDIAHVGALIGDLPGAGLLMATRTAVVWALCTSLLAGFGLAFLCNTGTSDQFDTMKRYKLVLLLVASVVFVLLTAVTYATLKVNDHPSTSFGVRTARSHLAFIVVTFCLGIVALISIVKSSQRVTRNIAGGVVLLALFAQSGFLFKDYNATVTQAAFMHVPTRARTVAKIVGQEQTLWLDGATIMPDFNLWMRVHSPANYDVINLESYERLYRAMLRPPNRIYVGGAELGILDGPVHPTSTRALQTMGIRRVVTFQSYPFVQYRGFGLGRIHHGANTNPTIFHFRPQDRQSTTLIIYPRNFPTGTVLKVQFSNENATQSVTRSVRIFGNIAVMPVPKGVFARGQRTVSIRPMIPKNALNTQGRIEGANVVQSATPGLRLIDSIEGIQVFSVPGAQGIASSPKQIRWVSTAQQALTQVTRPDFDPESTVILERNATFGKSQAQRQTVGTGTVETVTHQPRVIKLHVQRARAGYVVINQNKYPGWSATVNGTATPVIRANSTYMAVSVPKGTSIVILRFSSPTIKIGMILTVATGVVLGLVLLAVNRQFLRRRSSEPVPSQETPLLPVTNGADSDRTR